MHEWVDESLPLVTLSSGAVIRPVSVEQRSEAMRRWRTAAEQWCLDNGLPDSIIGFGRNWRRKL